jgi:hypothetical protein
VVASAEDYTILNCYDEPLDKKRDPSSMSLSASTPVIWAHQVLCSTPHYGPRDIDHTGIDEIHMIYEAPLTAFASIINAKLI